MRLVLLLLPLLVGCASNQSGSDPKAECEQAVYQDPTVQAIYGGSNMDYTKWLPVRSDLAVAKREAYLRCMRSKGLAPPGGVEPVKPPYW